MYRIEISHFVALQKRPNCGLCGNPGHTVNRCPNQLCYNCSLPGHKGFSCPSPKRDRFAKCTRCLTRGHSEEVTGFALSDEPVICGILPVIVKISIYTRKKISDWSEILAVILFGQF